MIQLAEISSRTPALFTVAGRCVRQLGQEDAPALQRLLERSSDYYEMLEGRPARPEAAHEEMFDGPAERVPHDVIALGIEDGVGGFGGFIGAVRHHRRPNQWYLGFQLLDPAWRGRGLGSTAYWAFQHWAVAQGADSMLLAVLAENIRGQRFWESLGYAQPRCYPAREIGLKQHVLIEYEKRLG
jgi:GNAT superfamily N-acetyltransferase